MTKHYDKQFKLAAVQYYHDHKELGLQGCDKNLGISQQTSSSWQKELMDTGDIVSGGSDNYASDDKKEIARLQRELRNATDALNVLKSYQHFGKMMEAIDEEVSARTEKATVQASSSNMLLRRWRQPRSTEIQMHS